MHPVRYTEILGAVNKLQIAIFKNAISPRSNHLGTQKYITMFIGHAYTMHTLYFDFPPSKCIFYDILKSKELNAIPKSNWVNVLQRSEGD